MKYIVLTFITLTTLYSYSQCGSNAESVGFTYNGHQYDLIEVNLSWTEAAACAVSKGGYLVEINDEAEHLALYNFLDTSSNYSPNQTNDAFGVPSIWLGGTDQVFEGNWIWDGDNDFQGVPFWQGLSNGMNVNGSFTAWGNIIPEPDNSGGDQNYLTWRLPGTSVNAGLWNDHHDNPWGPTELYFLVEYNESINSIPGDQNNISELNVFPNPSKNIIHISSDRRINHIEIFNLTGSVIINENIGALTSQIDITGIQNGVYFIKCFYDNNVIEIKKIIKH